MKDVVFLGPSLPLDAARALCDADYRPPAQMGDVYRAACEKPRAIAIIDGLFERVPAVWHKEILYALHQGIPVYGGSSMGALRAAELDAFGMIGIGRVYRDFAQGVLTDDDEVAVAHGGAEDGYRATSVAMVSLRAGIAAAIEQQLIDKADAAPLIEASKARAYPERSWEALLADAARMLDPSRCADLRGWLARTRPDCKRDDAIAVLQQLASSRSAPPPALPAFEFEHTVYWEAVETYCGQQGTAGAGARFERIRNHVRIFEADREPVVDRALLLFLAEQELRRSKLSAPDDRSALAAFRKRRGLASAAALADWMARQELSRSDCLELARLEAGVAIVRDRHIASVDRFLPTQLKLEGRYAEMAAKVARKWQAIGDAAHGALNEQDVDDFDTVLAWYQQRHGRITETLEEHASRLGVGSLHQWREEIFAEYLACAATGA